MRLMIWIPIDVIRRRATVEFVIGVCYWGLQLGVSLLNQNRFHSRGPMTEKLPNGFRYDDAFYDWSVNSNFCPNIGGEVLTAFEQH